MDAYTASEIAYQNGFKRGQEMLWHNERFDPKPGVYYVVCRRVGTDTDGNAVISEPTVYRNKVSIVKARDVVCWLELPAIPTDGRE